MSEALPRGGLSLLDVFARPPGFRADQRFSEAILLPEPEPAGEPEHSSLDSPYPVAEAFAQGYHAGREDAERAAQAAAETDEEARTKLDLSFSRLDKALEEELRLRLRETVAALCEAALAPLAIDENALVRRIEVAAAMLARADDERVIRLHPDDVKLLAPRLKGEWQIKPDPTLERGSIRVEGASGGVEDGPATWRRAIAEALHQI
jgi:flagellar assembly protein FliH